MSTMIVEMASSLLLGLVFLASAIPKLRHPKGFVLTVLEYRGLPPTLGQIYARLLPPVELFVAVLLLTGTAVRSAAVVTPLLLISFIIWGGSAPSGEMTTFVPSSRRRPASTYGGDR
jgi:uncharacterized membrane protein YphA (DoxX/SURF4 family)